MINLAVIGSCGKMGKRIIALIAEDPELKLTAALEKACPLPPGIPSCASTAEPDQRQMGLRGQRDKPHRLWDSKTKGGQGCLPDDDHMRPSPRCKSHPAFGLSLAGG